MADNEPQALYRGHKMSLQAVQDRLTSGQDRLARDGAPVLVIESTGDHQDPVSGPYMDQIIQDVSREFGVPLENQLHLPIRLPGAEFLSVSVYVLEDTK